MVIDKKVINYVKNQFKAGYTPDQIRAALANSGYARADINQAMSAAGAGKPKTASKPVKPGKSVQAGAKPAAGAGFEKPMIGFILSLIGGILLLLATVLPFAGITFLGTVFSFFPVLILILDATINMILGIIFPVVILIGAFLIRNRPDSRAPGLIVIVVSVITLIMLPGSFLGAIIGAIGGALAIIGK